VLYSILLSYSLYLFFGRIGVFDWVTSLHSSLELYNPMHLQLGSAATVAIVMVDSARKAPPRFCCWMSNHCIECCLFAVSTEGGQLPWGAAHEGRQIRS